METKSVIKSLNKFVGSVEEMEKVVMVPNRLHDLPCGQMNGVSVHGTADVIGLYDSFRILRNLKNELVTGHSLECGAQSPFHEQLQALNSLLRNLTQVATSSTATYKNDYKLIM